MGIGGPSGNLFGPDRFHVPGPRGPPGPRLPAPRFDPVGPFGDPFGEPNLDRNARPGGRGFGGPGSGFGGPGSGFGGPFL